MKLTESLAVVTGAGSGLGRHFATRIAEAGGRVAALDVDGDALAALERDSAAGRIVAIRCDVADEVSVEAAFDEATKQLGGVNVLVNNAGIFRDALLVRQDRATGDITTMSTRAWDQVIDVDLRGPFFCTRAFAERHVRTGSDRGVIVNISSVARHGNVGQTNYSAAKAGLVAQTTVWAKELARYGVRCGAIAPGFIETPILDGMPEAALNRMLGQVPLGRVGRPEEIWLGVRFVIECDYFTGRCIDIDGGVTL